MTPNCSIWIEGVDVIQTNIRLNWTLSGFKENGGTNKFKENLADSLGIKQTFIQILSVREGSVIVDFQIVQAEEDSTFQKKGGLSQVKNDLYQKIETQKLWLGAPILNATVVGRSISSTTSLKNAPVSAFVNQDKWDAKGTEVWIIPPPKKAPPAQVIIVISTKDVIVEKSLPGSSLFAIIFGILLAVGIILYVLGIFLYCLYKKCKEENDLQRAATEVDQHNSCNQKKKIKSVDIVNQSGESPLKGYRDNTIYDDDEALEEQYHPMSHRLYNQYAKDDEFNTNRKVKEDDYLMTQQNKEDERRTRDYFFDKKEEEQAQATFGIAPMSDRSISRGSDTDFENPVIGSIRSHSQADEEYHLTQEQESPVKMLQGNALYDNESPPAD